MNYPTWICDPCGRRLGRFYINGRYVGPPMRGSTMQTGCCDVCRKKGPVTTPLDYGHLVDDWHKQ